MGESRLEGIYATLESAAAAVIQALKDKPLPNESNVWREVEAGWCQLGDDEDYIAIHEEIVRGRGAPQLVKADLRAMASSQTGELIKLVEQRRLSRVEINHAAEYLGRYASDCALDTLLKLLKDPEPIVREGAIFGCREMYARGLEQQAILKAIDDLMEKETIQSVRLVAEDFAD